MDHKVFAVSHSAKTDIAAEIATRPARTLFFVRTKHGADRLATQLRTKGVEAAAIHGNLTQGARKKALDRDGRRCWFCGFTSTAHQEVHHLDDDHANNRLDNLVTICNIDHLCFHLGLAAMRGAIFLAVVPELTQAEITNLIIEKLEEEEQRRRRRTRNEIGDFWC